MPWSCAALGRAGVPGVLREGKAGALPRAGHLELWPGEFAHFLGTCSLLAELLGLFLAPLVWVPDVALCSCRAQP